MNQNSQIKIGNEILKGGSIAAWCAEQLVDPDLLEWKREMLEFILEWINDKDHMEVHTSGTTGKPKKIRLKKSWMSASAERTNRIFGLNERINVLHCLPINYIAGKMMLVRALTGGFNLMPVPPSANPFAGLKTKVHFVALTPYQLFHSLSHIKNERDLKVLVGGGAVDPQLERLLQDAEFEAVHSFGMAETCSHIALRKLNGESRSKAFSVLNGVSISRNKDGCLKVKVSYMDNEVVETQDVVNIISPKEFEWIGRKDNIINSGGIKINPEKVEAKFYSILKNKQFFIGSMKDDALGEKAILVIENDYDSELLVKNIKSMYSSANNKFELPGQILIVKEIYRNSSGKVLRSDTMQAIESGKLAVVRKYSL